MRERERERETVSPSSRCIFIINPEFAQSDGNPIRNISRFNLTWQKTSFLLETTESLLMSLIKLQNY